MLTFLTHLSHLYNQHASENIIKKKGNETETREKVKFKVEMETWKICSEFSIQKNKITVVSTIFITKGISLIQFTERN